MISIHGTTMTYTLRGAEPVAALDGVTIQVAPGEFAAVTGPSGCGKSTLLLVAGGMLTPTSGRVAVHGTDLYELSAEERSAFRRKNIGFLFQRFQLVPYLTALENVTLPLVLDGVTGDAAREKASGLLDRVGLGKRKGHKPSELSVGQQQRVALARMLANDPPLVLADEPTGNLDPATTTEMVDFLAELNRGGKTVLVVTHTPEVAKRAGRVIALADGKVRGV